MVAGIEVRNEEAPVRIRGVGVSLEQPLLRHVDRGEGEQPLRFRRRRVHRDSGQRRGRPAVLSGLRFTGVEQSGIGNSFGKSVTIVY